MSHIDSSALSQYNSLMDPHLSGYFNNQRMRRHLNKAGMIDKRGEIVSENTYRLNMARKEHKKHVRELLAQAIVHKTLDMERTRQVAIRKKLEEIAKHELVKRVREERGRKGDEDILPYLSPRLSRSRPTSAYTPVLQSRNNARPKSAPASRSKSRKRHDSQGSERLIAVDEDGIPLTPRGSETGSESTVTSSRRGGRNARPKSSKYPRGQIDDKHLYSLDQHTLREYRMAQWNIQNGQGPSPFLLPQPGMTPAPPATASPRSPARGRRRVQPTDAQGRPIKPKSNKNSLTLHRKEPAMPHRTQIHTGCKITMHYFGSSLHLSYEQFDPRDDVLVEQQHCGGNTLHVFREKVLPGKDFTFESRRHRGYPFGLTLYVNGVEDCRLSACCEYKHSKGAKLGGKLGHFGIVSVSGAAPCYKCQIAEEMKNKDKNKKKKSAKKADKSGNDSDSPQTVDMSDRDGKKSKRKDKDTDRSAHTVTGVSDDEDEYRKSDTSVTVPVSDDGETSRSKTDSSYGDNEVLSSDDNEVVEGQKVKPEDGNYDDDFDDDDDDQTKTATSRTATSRSRSSSGSRSRSRSRSPSPSARSRSRSPSPSGRSRSPSPSARSRSPSPSGRSRSSSRSRSRSSSSGGRSYTDDAPSRADPTSTIDDVTTPRDDVTSEENNVTDTATEKEENPVSSVTSQKENSFQSVQSSIDDEAVKEPMTVGGESEIEAAKSPSPNGESPAEIEKDSSPDRTADEEPASTEPVVKVGSDTESVKSDTTVKSSGSNKSGGSVKSSGSNKSRSSVKSSGSNKSGGSVKSSGSNKSGGSVKSSGSRKSDSSVKSTGSQKSSGSVKSTGSNKSGSDKFVALANETAPRPSSGSSTSSRSSTKMTATRGRKSSTSSTASSASSVKAAEKLPSPPKSPPSEKIGSGGSKTPSPRQTASPIPDAILYEGPNRGKTRTPSPVVAETENIDKTGSDDNKDGGEPDVPVTSGSPLPEAPSYDRPRRFIREMSSDEEEEYIGKSDKDKVTAAEVHATDDSASNSSSTAGKKTPTPPSSPKSDSLRGAAAAGGETAVITGGGVSTSYSPPPATTSPTTKSPDQAASPEIGVKPTSSINPASDSESDSDASSTDSDSDSDSDTETDTPRQITKQQSSTSDDTTDTETPRSSLASDPKRVETKDGITIRHLPDGPKLEITEDTLTPEKVSELCSVIESQGTLHNLTLTNVGLTDQDLETIADVIRKHTSPVSDLNTLNLNHNKLSGGSIEAILKIVSNKTDLSKLYLHGNALSRHDALVAGLLKLHRFRLSDEERTADSEQLQAIRGAAESVVSDVMQEVLHDSSLASVLSPESPDVSGASIGGGLSLSALDLGETDINDSGAKAIAELLTNKTNLKNLIISGNKNMGSEGMIAIANAMKVNTSVTSLSLDYCNLDTSAVMALADALRHNTTLKDLDLEGNNIDIVAGAALLDMARVNKSLESIEIARGNSLGDDLLANISQALSNRG